MRGHSHESVSDRCCQVPGQGRDWGRVRVHHHCHADEVLVDHRKCAFRARCQDGNCLWGGWGGWCGGGGGSGGKTSLSKEGGIKDGRFGMMGEEAEASEGNRHVDVEGIRECVPNGL